MPKKRSGRYSAGLLLYRWREGVIQILLGHPGGPFFRNKDDGSWTIPKGLLEPDEDPLEGARREFHEETGMTPPLSGFLDLGQIRYKNGKRLRAWAFEGSCDPSRLKSNSFEMEWPPKSGKHQSFPEIDRFGLFGIESAVEAIHPAQLDLLRALIFVLKGEPPQPVEEANSSKKS